MVRIGKLCKKDFDKAYELYLDILNVIENEKDDNLDIPLFERVIISSFFIYKLYKIEKYKSFTYKEFLSLDSSFLDDKILNVLTSFMTKKALTSLIKLTSKYERESFGIVVIMNVDKDADFSYTTPSSLISLVKKILLIQKKDEVIDVCSGLGSFITSSSYDLDDAHYVGYEIRDREYNISKARSIILKKRIDLKKEDAFFFDAKDFQSFDKGFANYPFDVDIFSRYATSDFLKLVRGRLPEINKETSSDWMFNLLLSALLNVKGRGITIMKDSGLNSDNDRIVRKFMIEQNFIEGVINLNDDLVPSSNSKISLLVINKNKIDENIKILDSSSIFTKEDEGFNILSEQNLNYITSLFNYEIKDSPLFKLISKETCRNKNYSLSFSDY